MKKLLFLGGIVALIIWTSPVLAATNFSLSPSHINVNAGQTFQLTLKVDPQAVNNYTVKIELDYPADILEIKSFSFSNSWSAIAQPGYDLIDNQVGRLVKTAGYPNGFSSPKIFGTVFFKSKKSGTSQIKLTTNSLALDQNSQDVSSNVSVQSQVIISPVSQSSPSKIVQTKAPKETEALGTQQETGQPKKTKSKEETSELEVKQEEPEVLGVETKQESGILEKFWDSQLSTWLIGLINFILFIIVMKNRQKKKQ